MAPQLTDPTRVIQGVVTGIGFLCAGLTSAASLWAASSIGILLGMGFYFAAIMLTLLCARLMMWGANLESHLSSHPAIAVMLRGVPKRHFKQAELVRFANDLGFRFAPGSWSIELVNEREEWRVVCTAKRKFGGETLTRFASSVPEIPRVAEYRVAQCRPQARPTALEAAAGRGLPGLAFLARSRPSPSLSLFTPFPGGAGREPA